MSPPDAPGAPPVVTGAGLARSTTPPDGFARLGSASRYRGPVVSVRSDHLRTGAGGHETDYDVVEHPGSVAVVALDEAGRVLMVRQWRPVVGAAEWELPAGLLDVDGESAQDAARRELAEEAGATARHWRPLVVLHTSPGVSTERSQVFLAKGTTVTGQRDLEPGEASMTSAWVPLDAALAAIGSGDITDALAVAGLLAAARSPGGQSG